MEFNPDGSLKLGGAAGRKQDEETRQMTETRCVKLLKEATRTYAPKLCTLYIETSPHIEPGRIEQSLQLFTKRVQSTMKVTSTSPTSLQVSIGNEFSRCNDCHALVSSLREGLNSNFILKKGTCTYKGLEYL